MKKALLTISAVLLGQAPLLAQGAIDLFTLSDSQLRGTSRYMSMAGAFGALGGDISTLTQNPAGIGVYRSSDITATLDIDPQRTTLMNTGSQAYTNKQTRFSCNNFGYVGAINLNNSVMPFFQWGVSYNRLNSYDRYYRGYFPTINTSWSNYVAYNSQGYAENELFGDENYDPFFDSSVDWLSALAYNTYLVNPNPHAMADGQDYVGLFQSVSSGDAEVEVLERGYIDEYSVNFGGNFSDMIYWGIGFGIRDLSYTRTANYNEQISNALVPSRDDDSVLDTGAAEWSIDTYQRVSGTGFNMKLGLIFKPVNEFRLGFAVHTPTWYNLNFEQSADITYGLGMIEDDGFYTYDNYPGADDNPYASTGDGYWSRSMKTPWRLMASAAGVVGGRFILSADYVYEAYPSMATSGDDPQREDIIGDVKQYYQGSNELRLGAEMRITPRFSVRAGYGYKSTAAKSAAMNGNEYIYTSGVSTLYAFDGDRHNVTFGLGYRFGQFYVDAAYIHSTQTSEWYAFSPFPKQDQMEYALATGFGQHQGPRAQLRDTRNRIALTIGFRF